MVTNGKYKDTHTTCLPARFATELSVDFPKYRPSENLISTHTHTPNRSSGGGWMFFWWRMWDLKNTCTYKVELLSFKHFRTQIIFGIPWLSKC